MGTSRAELGRAAGDLFLVVTGNISLWSFSVKGLVNYFRSQLAAYGDDILAALYCYTKGLHGVLYIGIQFLNDIDFLHLGGEFTDDPVRHGPAHSDLEDGVAGTGLLDIW